MSIPRPSGGAVVVRAEMICSVGLLAAAADIAEDNTALLTW
ncbi:MAG: hypothetical protein NZ602_11670 [Thermoguttaceae bacterium]|nr:hypothetical protein [Thermoguttaceae bacterium]MDW8039158.1 hypothetical protein [Thermoguttaceae bacterium]